ncbi:GvpL/GvpF family gas vesicle protein [Trichocoleus sp. FACHB-591]|uniref:gas vesicle protein GvpF n=1 Tax=Trichocoleus sp. FACHB-591 TaxID=2692872 RepID=UPI001687528C|nr:GvpL/GvpF family gas vesicle protein [Trichocoleus sp. FACHB-591]MBD2097063.1 GvpL/GvpF family gas vesicle protein [Trichocoleus sp. FACHB-591]
MGTGLYLYGIFPTPGPQQLEAQGLDKQPVHTHVLDGFTFLYSEAQQERYLASRRNLLDHEKVLEQAMHTGHRTLLPLQFGLIVEDWRTVTEQLTATQGPQLEQLFHKLDGRREVGVKIFWDAEAEVQALLAQDEQLRSERDRLEGKSLSMDEVIRIGQAIEQAVEARKQSIIRVFRSTLNPLASSALENDPLTEAMIYNAAYLIAWDDEAAFSEKVEALDLQFEGRLRIRYNNFTAPYNFAQLAN